MDYDKDGKLSFVEFCDHTYDIYKNYVEYETAGRRVPKPEEKFSELDLDKDRYTHDDHVYFVGSNCVNLNLYVIFL